VITSDEAAGTPPSGHPWLDSPDPDWPTVVWAGRMSEEKCVDTLIRAFEVLTKLRRARLILVGDGDERQSLEDLVERLGLASSVSFTGMVSDARPHLARASVVALSSRTEGLPTVLIEALALGRQVVSTNCPTGPAELLDGGRLGRLVPVGDHAALGRALDAAIQAPLPSASEADLDPYRIDQVALKYAAALGIVPRAALPDPRVHNPMTVTLAILCHDREEELSRAIASVQDCGFLEVIVVDNGSSPPLTPIEGTRWARLEDNHGVAAGRNALASLAKGDIVFFLDDDAVLQTPDAVHRVARLFSQDPGLAAIACRIERGDGTIVSSEYPFRGRALVADLERPCAYFVGAAHAVRRKAWIEAGGLDEGFGYSTEEIDLAMALLGQGHRCWYAPDIIVQHFPSTRGRRTKPEIPALRLRNRITYARRHLPWAVAMIHISVWALKTFHEAVRSGSIKPWLAAFHQCSEEIVIRRPLSWPTLFLAHCRGGRVLW
jgi:GT2 family glycosyltransferase